MLVAVQCDAASSPMPSSSSSAALSSWSMDALGGLAVGGPGQQMPGPGGAAAMDVRDAAVDACHVGVVTDPDCLGPCEPGTTVTLEGIVWNETENGMCYENT